MGLSITQNQYNQCNAKHFGNTLSKAQSSETPSKTNSGPFSGCARCHMEPAEKAFKKYESRVNGALRSVIQINPKFVEYARLKANPNLVNTQNKKFLSKIDKAQKEIQALDKQARPLLDGLIKGGVQDVDAKKLRDDRAMQIFAEGADDLDLHLLRTNFKAIKIAKQTNGEWMKKEQKENSLTINPDQSQTNQNVEKNLQINADDIQIEKEVQNNPLFNPEKSQVKQEDPFRSDLRSINRLVKAEQGKRKSIELEKQQKKMDEVKEVKSELVNENQETGDGNPLDIQTEYQTPKPQSDDEKTDDSSLSNLSNDSDKELIGDENSLVDPSKTQTPFGQQDGLNQTNQQQQINQN